MSQSARDSSFDVLKGVGILAVISLHSSSNSARLFASQYTPEWWLLTLFNRFVNWAVPLFLLVSAVLWARSAARKADWARFYRSRLMGLGYPLLVWTVLYLAFRYHFVGPFEVMDIEARTRDLLLGKAWYHLYFLAIVIQFAVLFPLLFGLIRRLPALWMAVAAGVAAQAVVFYVQKEHLRFSTPASLVFWHLLGLVPGIWVGANWNTVAESFGRAKWPLAVFTAVAGGLFLRDAAMLASDGPINNLVYKWAEKVYPFSAAFLLLGWSTGWGSLRSPLERALRWMGENSLQLFLIHPMLIHFIDDRRIQAPLNELPLAPLWAFLLLLAASVGLTWLLGILRLDGPLFGRWPARPKPAPSAPEAPAPPAGTAE